MRAERERRGEGWEREREGGRERQRGTDTGLGTQYWYQPTKQSLVLQMVQSVTQLAATSLLIWVAFADTRSAAVLALEEGAVRADAGSAAVRVLA